MSEFKVGDKVKKRGDEALVGKVLSVDDDGSCGVQWDHEWDAEMQSDLDVITTGRSLTDEVQDLINILVSTGNDNKRKLSRQVAQLMDDSRGRLTRGEKLQAAAMLIVSAGLAAQSSDERGG